MTWKSWKNQGMNNHFGGSLNLTSCGLNLSSREVDLTKIVFFTSDGTERWKNPKISKLQFSEFFNIQSDLTLFSHKVKFPNFFLAKIGFKPIR